MRKFCWLFCILSALIGSNIRINLLSIDDEFEYKVPEGIHPIDITDEIKKTLPGN